MHILQEQFELFRQKYQAALHNYLHNPQEIMQAHKLSQFAASLRIDTLSIIVIHHDALNNELEKLDNNHLQITDLATQFLEHILADFKNDTDNLHLPLLLLNEYSVTNAVRIKRFKNILTEKEVLLKEIYHRVKNNLQVIASLLHLQADLANDAITKKILLENATRIHSMSIVHELLYQEQNLYSINMSEYIYALVTHLYQALNIDPFKILLKSHIDQVYLGIELALPCGLIINELLTNAMTHAFENILIGEITLNLKILDRNIMLQICDNGKGLNPSLFDEPKTLGFQLIKNLCRQLNATFEVRSNQGTQVTISFSA